MTMTFPAPRTDPALSRSYGEWGLHSLALMSQQSIRAEASAPHATALEFEGRTWTRRELNDEAHALAHHLRVSGVGRGDVVCVLSPNDPGVIIAALATWHLGAVLLPVVDIYREREIAQVLDMVEAAAVVTVEINREAAMAEIFDDLLSQRGVDLRARILLTGSRAGWTSRSDLSPAPVRSAPDSPPPQAPCLLLLTSGSTGRAKVAVHSSQSLLAEAAQMARAWEWTGSDVSYVSVPLSHISGLLRGIVVPTLLNSPVFLRPRWNTEQAVDDLSITQAKFTTVPGLLLAEFIERYEHCGTPPLGLKIISVGVSDGAYAAIEAAELHGMHPSRAYGLSELPTATIATPQHNQHARMYTCGPAAPGVDIDIRDESGASVPSGASGEVVVRGPEQMLGYLDPADDLGAWTPDGFIRTGDLGMLDQGNLRLVGRIKDIINRGGEKISSIEIEDCLREHPDVAEVAVVPGPDARLGEVPVAFVVRKDHTRVASAELSDFLHRQGLAKQKIPQDWRYLADLPLTGSGKIQKGVLRTLATQPAPVCEDS